MNTFNCNVCGLNCSIKDSCTLRYKIKDYWLNRWKDYISIKTLYLRIPPANSNKIMPIEINRYKY